MLKEFYLRMDRLKDITSFEKELSGIEKKLRDHLTSKKKCEDCYQEPQSCGICKDELNKIYEFDIDSIRYCHACDVSTRYSHTKCFNSAPHKIHRDQLK